MPAFFMKPVLHFFVLGALLYVLTNSAAPPAAPPSVEYPSAERIALLKGEWLTSTGRAPDVATLERLVQLELDQAMLFNEALRLNLHLRDRVVQQRLLRDMRFLGDSEGKSDADLLQQAYALNMHKNDLVVKRRLVQAMESIYRAPGEAVEPTEQDLEKIYQEKQQEFTLPASMEISHVFISGDKHGAEAEARALRLHKSFALDEVEPEKALLSSDPFLSGNHFPFLSPRQLQKHFGESFTQQAFACPAQAWCGPISSPYGQHVVWVHGRKEPRRQELSAVRDKLVYHFRRQQGDRVQAEQMKALRARYEVVKS
ncbi:MAG: peptidyl-prolyl cis-trans isomerase [Pseudomonadales bacterium]